MVRIVLANNRTTRHGDHNLDALATSKLVGQDLATEETFFPTNKARNFTCTACGQASRDRVRAMRAWIDNAPARLYGWRCAANDCGCTTNRCRCTATWRAAIAGVNHAWCRNCQTDCDSAAHQKFSKHLYFALLKHWKKSGRTERLPILLASLAYSGSVGGVVVCLFCKKCCLG